MHITQNTQKYRNIKIDLKLLISNIDTGNNLSSSSSCMQISV